MRSGNAYKKFDMIFHVLLLIMGMAMIVLSVFNIAAPDRRSVWVVLGILFTVESIYRFYYIKKHSQDDKYTGKEEV